MNDFRRSNWSCRIDLAPADKIQLRNAVSAERSYYNLVLDSLSGPIRTMPDTLKAMTGRWETLVGAVAAAGCDLGKLKADQLTEDLAVFRDLLFAANGRLVLDSKTAVILNLFGPPAGPHPEVRRAIALELLRYAREQVNLRAQALDRADQVYKFAVQQLVLLDGVTKRHVQVPRKVIQLTEGENGQLSMKLPFLSQPVELAGAPPNWQFLYLREDLDGRYTLELGNAATYQLTRTDLASFRRPAKGKRA